ncbi:MAG: hypothetical protein V4640_04050 [Verrucomicrobiota bacterium]
MNKSLIGIFIGCVSAAVGGYLLARQSFSAVAGDAVISSARNRSTMNQSDRMESGAARAVVKSRSAAQLAAVKEDLRQRFRSSPDATHDWPLREQAAAILASMKPEELEEFAKEYLPVGASSDIRSLRMIHDPLLQAILHQWGLKSPEAACHSLAETHVGALTVVFEKWLQRDSTAACAWLELADFPQGGDTLKKQLEMNSLTRQATDDFSAARESLGILDPEAQKQLLREWSKLLAHDPAKRAELLALLASRGDVELLEKCYQNLTWEMAEKSPADAAKFIEGTNLTEEQKNTLNDQVVVNWAMKDPVQAFAKWAELERQDIPPTMLHVLSNWSMNSPGAEQAIDWAKKLTPGPAREQFKATLIERISSLERYDQAADLSASLDDPAERIRQLKDVKRRWEEKWPEDANAWFEKLPQADQDAIARKLE